MARLLEADGVHPFVLACRECTRQDHPACSGRPDAPWPDICRCRKCWQRIAQAEWRAARLRNSTQAMRTWGDCLLAAHLQSAAQKDRRIARGKKRARCIGCGRPCFTWRVDRRGSWCSPACKMRHARARWKARESDVELNIGSSEPAPSAGGDSRTQPDVELDTPAEPDPMQLWMAVHGR